MNVYFIINFTIFRDDVMNELFKFIIYSLSKTGKYQLINGMSS
jgi:hypothetical protein